MRLPIIVVPYVDCLRVNRLQRKILVPVEEREEARTRHVAFRMKCVDGTTECQRHRRSARI